MGPIQVQADSDTPPPPLAPYHASLNPEQGMEDTTTPSKSAYKRTKTTKKDLLARYRVRLEGSREWRKEAGFDRLWDRLEDLYKNKQFEGISTEDRIAV